MTLTLNAAIAQCPRSLFGDKDKGIAPKYRKIFATVVKALLADAGEKFSEKTVDLVADTVNISSMQRAIADHRATFTGIFDKKTGKYRPVEEKAPRKERGKPRPRVKDELGLDQAPKKAAKKLKASKKSKAPAKAPAKKTPSKTSEKGPSKPAKAPKSEKAGGVKQDAIAAARASLAAKKAAKVGKEKAPAKSSEETVEI